MNLSIILPTYNERGDIVRLIKKIIKICKNNNWKNYEITVIDDNSPDHTASYCERVFKRIKNVKIFTRLDERGLASAIKFGIVNTRGKYIVIMDTDFNHNPDDIYFMLNLITKYSLVIGSRFIKNGGMQNKNRYYLSKIYNYFIKKLSGTNFSDSLSGFFCIRRRDLEMLDLDYIFRGYGEYYIRLLVLVKKMDLSVVEIPVYYKNRGHGLSKSRFMSMLISYTGAAFEAMEYVKER